MLRIGGDAMSPVGHGGVAHRLAEEGDRRLGRLPTRAPGAHLGTGAARLVGHQHCAELANSDDRSSVILGPCGIFLLASLRQQLDWTLAVQPRLLPEPLPSLDSILPGPRHRRSSRTHHALSSAQLSPAYRLGREPAPGIPAAPSVAPTGLWLAWSHLPAAQAPSAAFHLHPAATASSPTQTESCRNHATPGGLSRPPYGPAMRPSNSERCSVGFYPLMVNPIDSFYGCN